MVHSLFEQIQWCAIRVLVCVHTNILSIAIYVRTYIYNIRMYTVCTLIWFCSNFPSWLLLPEFNKSTYKTVFRSAIYYALLLCTLSLSHSLLCHCCCFSLCCCRCCGRRKVVAWYKVSCINLSLLLLSMYRLLLHCEYLNQFLNYFWICVFGSVCVCMLVCVSACAMFVLAGILQIIFSMHFQ